VQAIYLEDRYLNGASMVIDNGETA